MVAAGDEAARLAFEVYCYRIRKYVGAYTAVLGRVDAIVFTAGVGQHSPEVREASLRGLETWGVEVDAALNAAATGTEAAVVSGASNAKILFVHIAPNIMPLTLLYGSIAVGWAILTEASISFLGFGVQPPTPAWGSMLSESRDFLYVAWWLAAFPGIALALTALGVNLLGDWLRDTLDPKLRV